MNMFLELIDYYDLAYSDEKQLIERIKCLSYNEIRNICDSLGAAIKTGKPSIKKYDKFDFIASNSLSATRGFSCTGPSCRMDKIRHVASFATLYSDTVYIPNYFNDIKHMKSNEIKPNFWSDIMVVNSLRPAIEAGYLKLIDFDLCLKCTKPYLEPVDALFTKELMNELEDYYIDKAQVRVVQDTNFYKKSFEVRSSLWDHGVVSVEKSNLKSFKIGMLSKKQIKASGLIADKLTQSLVDVKYHSITSSYIGTSFLTDAVAQEQLLYKCVQNDERTKINEALGKMFLETPIFGNISLDKIVEIRREETESFDEYRRTLNASLKTLVEKKGEITSKMVDEYYLDVIKPEVDKLDRKIRLSKKTLMKKALRNVSIMGVCLGTGLALGLPKSALQAFGAVTYAGQTIASLFEIYEESSDVQLNSLYFIWKINQAKSAELNK
jgi:hypothetical protein